MDKEKIFGLSSLARVNLYKIKNAKTKKYECTYQNYNKDGAYGNEITLARFDTEEKGRMYIDAIDKGMEIGYDIPHPVITNKYQGGN